MGKRWAGWLVACAWLAGGSPVGAAPAKSTVASCLGDLRATTATKVTCRKAPKRCDAGSVVWDPGCVKRCRRKAWYRCRKIKARQRLLCRKAKTKEPTDKKPLTCPQISQARREKCRILSEAAQAACRRKASTRPCRQSFANGRSRCDDVRQSRLVSCRKQHRRRSRKCRRLAQKLNASKARVCKKRFLRCLERCDAPVRWPCRKKCFGLRHKCFVSRRDRPSQCRSTSSRLLSECEIKVERRQTRCISKSEQMMYRCMQSLSRKRVLCMINVGTRYRRCIGKVQDRQLLCWFGRMDKRYLCSGQAYTHCRSDLGKVVRRCRRKCPKCEVTARR